MGAQVGDEHYKMLETVGVCSSLDVWATQYGPVYCHADGMNVGGQDRVVGAVAI